VEELLMEMAEVPLSTSDPPTAYGGASVVKL